MSANVSEDSSADRDFEDRQLEALYSHDVFSRTVKPFTRFSVVDDHARVSFVRRSIDADRGAGDSCVYAWTSPLRFLRLCSRSH